MNKYKLLIGLLATLLLLCSCQQGPSGTTTVTTDAVTVARIAGDVLPDYAQSLPEIPKFTENVSDFDAVFISAKLLREAGNSNRVKTWLQAVAQNTILAVAEAEPTEIIRILGISTIRPVSGSSPFLIGIVRDCGQQDKNCIPTAAGVFNATLQSGATVAPITQEFLKSEIRKYTTP